MKLVRTTAALAAVGSLVLTSACSSGGSGSSHGGKVPSITLLNAYVQDPFWQGCSAGAKRAAKDLGVSHFRELDGNNSVSTQAGQIDTTIQQKPDAMLIAALDSNAVVPQLQHAVDKGIRVYAFNTAVPHAKLSATVAMDEVATGAAAADHMVQLAKAAGKTHLELLHLVGAIATEPVRLRRQGFNEEIKKPVDGLTIHMSEVVTDWDSEKAVNGLSDRLTRGPIDAIFTESDFLTPFLVPVLKRNGYTQRDGDKHIIIGGLGGIPGGFDAIRNGWQDFTLNYPIDGMCDMDVRLAVADQQGKSFDDSWQPAASAAGLDPYDPKLVTSATSGPSVLLTASYVDQHNVDDKALWANNYQGAS